MPLSLRLALVALLATSACDDPPTSAFQDPPPEPEPAAQPEPAPTADPQPAAEPDPQPASEPAAEPEPRVGCVDDGACFEALGPHGRCVGTPSGGPDVETPANNECVLAPSGRTIRFTGPRFSIPEEHVDALNAEVAAAWRAEGLGFVVRLERPSTWQRQPDGGWLPEYRGVIYASRDGDRVAPGVDPIPLATSPVACDDAAACTDIIFIDSLSERLRLPADTEDACAPSPFAMLGSARLQIDVDADGLIDQSRLAFRVVLPRSAARETPWGEGTLADLLDGLGVEEVVDSNRDDAIDAWDFGFSLTADSAAPNPLSGRIEGDCRP